MISSKTTKGPILLVELFIALLLAAVLGAVMVANVGTNDDAIKYEQTRTKMGAIRVAIFGSDSMTDAEGKRNHFGYFGDVGSLPNTLADLVTKPEALQPWAMNTLHGFGSGWRGPYVTETEPYDTDGWGRKFSYSLAGPPSLTSLGSDNASGGTGYEADLVMQFPTAARIATVKGILEDLNARRASYDVTLGYPAGASGAITTTTSTTDARGNFTFTDIPFGVRSVRVTSPINQPARTLVVDRPEVTIPSTLFNLFGVREAVGYVTSSVRKNAEGLNVTFSVSSSYKSALQLDAITVSFTSAQGKLTTVVVNGVSETFAGVDGDTHQDLNASLILPPKTAATPVELRFSAPPTALTVMTVTFEWVNRSRPDIVSFTVPLSGEIATPR